MVVMVVRGGESHGVDDEVERGGTADGGYSCGEEHEADEHCLDHPPAPRHLI